MAALWTIIDKVCINSGGHSSSSAACGGLSFATLRVDQSQNPKMTSLHFFFYLLSCDIMSSTWQYILCCCLLHAGSSVTMIKGSCRLTQVQKRVLWTASSAVADGAELVTAVFNTEQRLQGRSIVCSLTFAPSSTTCPQSLSDSGSLALYACGALSSATVNKLRNRRPALICIDLQGQRLSKLHVWHQSARRHNTFI